MVKDGIGVSSVRELHNQAMSLAHQALVAHETGDKARAESLAREASRYETEAANLVPNERASEPTRSILYRSAASLAYQARDFKASQELIEHGLAGFPPPDVEQELLNLRKQVNFEYHLQTHGVLIEEEELDLALQGNAVGLGTIVYDEFIKRIEAFRAIIDRTVQRQMGRVYQRAGKLAQIYKPFTPILAAPREGSFIITMQFGRLEGQQMSLLFDAASVIDEIMTGFDLVNQGDESGLRDLIPNQAYFESFKSLAREIAPDGDKIQSVEFSNKRRTRTVGLTRSRNEIVLVSQAEQGLLAKSHQSISIQGKLDFATSRRETIVGLTTEDGKKYDIQVREGMDDLVRSYFGRWVVVTGVFDGRYIYPSDISSAEGY